MHLIGDQTINLPIHTTWELLNDAEVLQRCIPGCEELKQQSDSSFSVTLQAAVGPIKARFGGSLELSEVKPLESYNLIFEGSAGAMGFGRGVAKVALEPLGDTATRLKYEVDASIGGKLAQVGSRLVESVAKKMAENFFSRFEQEATAKSQGSSQTDSNESLPSAEQGMTDQVVEKKLAGASNSLNRWHWRMIAIVIILVALGTWIVNS